MQPMGKGSYGSKKGRPPKKKKVTKRGTVSIRGVILKRKKK